jgi:short-subunit dehydrogenase
MRLDGATALMTGAAGGLGTHLARALAGRGVHVGLSGRNEGALEALRDELRARGVRAEAVPADLSDPRQAAGLVGRAEAAIGPLDLLVNNAGVEETVEYPRLDDGALQAMVAVDLVAPMLLTRHALAGMTARGRGHVVNVGSLAGKGGVPYEAVYATTKAGLVGLTRSLRAELEGTPVGASVVCPGFVSGDGMYARMADELGVRAPLPLRPVPPERVVDAVLAAIEGDRPEVLVSAVPMRPLLALQELMPRLTERVVLALGTRRFFGAVAARRASA